MLAIAVLITIQYISLRRSLINELMIQARIIGENSTAALSFDHPEDAKETLGALRAAPNIVYAVIFTKEGEVFAELQSNDIEEKYLPPIPQKDGYRIGINYLKVFKSIILDDETIGTLYIQSSMKKLYTPLMWYAVAAGVVIVVSLNIAFLMLSKLQQTITKPLLQLRSATTKITQGNLTARAEVLSSDELGDLTASFNVMAESLQKANSNLIDEISDHSKAEKELKKHRNQLEEMVTERTFELIDTNKQLKQEIAERKHADEQVKASLKEKEILLQEIHHRVKNNLQVIISLLRLQSRGIKDQKILTMFKESQDRINSMALVHEKIYYSKDLANIRLRDYVNDLASDLFKSYNLSSGNIELKMEIEDIPIGIDTSIPCGLIINELLSNSLKHAFPENRKGEIKIEIRSAKESEIEMVYSDNGIGLPKSFDFRKSTGFGFRMIIDLVEYKLMGNIKLIQDGGTIFQIRFKEIKYKKRI